MVCGVIHVCAIPGIGCWKTTMALDGISELDESFALQHRSQEMVALPTLLQSNLSWEIFEMPDKFIDDFHSYKPPLNLGISQPWLMTLEGRSKSVWGAKADEKNFQCWWVLQGVDPLHVPSLSWRFRDSWDRLWQFFSQPVVHPKLASDAVSY